MLVKIMKNNGSSNIKGRRKIIQSDEKSCHLQVNATDEVSAKSRFFLTPSRNISPA
jgi:hypothetical protein